MEILNENNNENEKKDLEAVELHQLSMLENTNHETWLKIYKLFVYHEDIDEDIKKISANTLVVTGREDIGSKPKMSEEISKLIQGSIYKVIEKGKHLCNIECAENFNITIKEFIDNNAEA